MRNGIGIFAQTKFTYPTLFLYGYQIILLTPNVTTCCDPLLSEKLK
jgi:hypothetical protein